VHSGGERVLPQMCTSLAFSHWYLGLDIADTNYCCKAISYSSHWADFEIIFSCIPLNIQYTEECIIQN
jgi:hypothetical protein